MNRRARIVARNLVAVGAAIALAALPVLAQEDQSSPVDSPTGWAFRWLNFAIIFAGILWFATKICGPYFRGRTEEIAGKVAEGTRAKEAAEQQRKEAEAKLATIDQDVARMREEAKRSGEAEVLRLKEASKKEAEMIERAAQEEIAAAQRSAKFELKVLAGKLAIDRAEVLLRQELTPQAETTLFRAFVEQLAANGADGSRN
jgi:F-type H+-transporting ATPase subunit b